MPLCSLGTLKLDRVAAMNDGVLSKFLVNRNEKPRLPSVRNISLAENPGVTDYGVKKLLTAYGPRLTGITLSDTSATHKSVEFMAKTCPNLQVHPPTFHNRSHCHYPHTS
jgi:hypothetical protein